MILLPKHGAVSPMVHAPLAGRTCRGRMKNQTTSTMRNASSCGLPGLMVWPTTFAVKKWRQFAQHIHIGNNFWKLFFFQKLFAHEMIILRFFFFNIRGLCHKLCDSYIRIHNFSLKRRVWKCYFFCKLLVGMRPKSGGVQPNFVKKIVLWRNSKTINKYMNTWIHEYMNTWIHEVNLHFLQNNILKTND